ncbi:prepilin-type N-terminal cleavage/methylation domain-containing protein [Vibrio splendidus]|uniref:pilin n=1 Tax=Vibrio splendidus TaxID=29497 RepID=UPI000C82DBDB|nr:prepilin-type N-terminal cleavage/methylation domain-containing protein [Vibrio splendidus]PMO91007.1 pilus assembly protein PilA [Vibrio splendidus]PMP18137.1 pilus assembly protein PilA [Vibrio splendidus]PMP26709.1 pilus assembly protein PilA [Vibrio splendidus]PMP40633.1 pilus assembly protein PilA [Vibrio splendidus]PMP43795.1 pilus assembly protein PilA [Vibrio splendidus]
MKNKNKRTNQKGFTLIELMIVVAIIGVLSAIAVPAYKDYVSKSEASSALATLKSVLTPAELQIQEDGGLTDLAALGTVIGANSLGNLAITNTAASSAAMTFTFTGGSLSSGVMTITRSNTGWACVRSANATLIGVDLEGCN